MKVRAPGKLVLAGEYAVLDGAPAVVLAVDRGVSCVVSASERLIIETPGDSRFLRAALKGAPPAKYSFQDWNPVLGIKDKPGFGGSAAATVAAVIAGGGVGSEAFEVHRAVQGSGSGVDVAASLNGGMILFEGGAVSPAEPVTPVVIYSGAGGLTAPRVAAYRRLEDRSWFVTRSRELTAEFMLDPVGATREGRALIIALAKAAGFVYETPALAKIAALALSAGGAAKPSGAGGGDCAVAFFESQDQERAFKLACERESLAVISVNPAWMWRSDGKEA